jgi:hypothetical protein
VIAQFKNENDYERKFCEAGAEQLFIAKARMRMIMKEIFVRRGQNDFL